MKKPALLFILFFLIGINAFSQIEKKTLLLGGSSDIGFSTDNSSHFFLDPDLGYFVSDRFCLGLSMPLAFLNDNFYWGLTPFGRYYFNVRDTRSLFLTASIGITSYLNLDYVFISDALSVGIGHVWFLNQSIGFETRAIASTSFEDLNFGIVVGFQIYFNKSKNGNLSNKINHPLASCIFCDKT